MPVIHSLFGGSSRHDLISFSSLNTWDATVDGLFPASRKGPGKEMPPFVYTRVRSGEASEHRIPKGKEQGLHGGGVGSPSRFCHRIPLPEDAAVEQVLEAIRKGALMIPTPKKEVKKGDSGAEASRAEQL